MNVGALPAAIALVVQLALGLVVLQANPRRRSNQCFLILSLASSAWLASLGVGLNTTDARLVDFCIRQASAAGALYLAALNLLRISICKGQTSWRRLLRHFRMWLITTTVVVIFCQTGIFLRGVRMSADGGPTPVYGPGVPYYAAYLAIALVVLVVCYVRDIRHSTRGERAELSFMLIGGVIAIAVALIIAFPLEHWIGPDRALWFAPFRMIIFSVVIAYGMVTRKIMDVGLFVRRVISYSLLATYLLGLYIGVYWLTQLALNRAGPQNADEIAHVTAALVIAFAMAPARGVSRRLAERLFISSHHLDFRATVSKATEILSSITTLHDLLQRFGGTIAEAAGAERVLILLEGREAFTTKFSFVQKTDRYPATCDLESDGVIVARLKAHHQPIVADELQRMRQTNEITRLSERMRELNVAIATGIFSREHLAGIMLLGPRASGRIYGSLEQNALSVLCGQLAVAVENAQLFTEVQNARIYNEILLQNLTTGVIATGVDERITVFNNEAGEILQIKPPHVLDQPLSTVPGPLRTAFRNTLDSGEGQNAEITLQTKGEGLTVRISTSIFHGQDNRVLGALMVLTDVTTLKRLELQIRRSDRLASLGTLSAGMAHEIKNPLVSIKTFAQLLPERYNDPDFRETFSNLIGHEIDRIDSLVNQLLRFARPAKPHLQPSHVHAILEKSLLLVGHRLYQKDIKLTRSWEANVDTIRADADQLEQVFLNFFINAMDAMKNGGELNVSTEVLTDEEWLSHLAGGHNGDTHEVLRVTIKDNGEGIRSEDLAHVFDPFFTTKDYGTGLGLSVVHGIVQEHGGQIEVESELSKGTAFHILLPLVRFDSEVVAA
jgi:nitrogen-specific signal transduction histidine kinase